MSDLLYPAIPRIEVRYSDLSYAEKIPRQVSGKAELPSVFGTLWKTCTFFPRLVGRLAGGAAAKVPTTEDFIILEGISGVIKPGTLTL